MAVHTTYEFYTSTYLGTAIDSDDFLRLATRASQVIDNLTFNRALDVITADEDAVTIEMIEMAVCAVADEMHLQESNGNVDGITSERVGNYAVTFGAGSKATLSNKEKQEKAARFYLGQTGLMFRGFTDAE